MSAIDVFTARRAAMTQTMCTPYDVYSPYAPFTYTHYPHEALMGYLGAEPWLTVFQQEPASLIPLNPFEASRFRPKGLAIWDAAVGIPACCARDAQTPVHTKDTPVLFGTNKYWETTLIPAINRVGPLGPGGALVRPTDKYIVDLTKMGEMGYRIRLAAHAMAHMRGDHKDESKPRKNDATKLGGYIAGITGELVFAYLYGLPFDISLRRDGIKADTDFKQYGIEVKTSTQFELPILKVPWCNGEAPRFDSTIAIVDVAAFIEPHPYGWTSRTMQYSPKDFWCCTPSIVMVAGWEMVDRITHQPLISSSPGDMGWPVGYGMHPLDMLGPDKLVDYLDLAIDARGPPVYNAHLRDVEDWLFSKDFDTLISRYPPVPCCIDCMSWNQRSEGAPVRPRESRPLKPGQNKALDEAWKIYDNDRKAIMKTMVEPAIRHYEASFYGNRREANRRRRNQIAQYKITRQRVDDARVLKRAIFKNTEGKDLNAAETVAYDAYCRQARKMLDAKTI